MRIRIYFKASLIINSQILMNEILQKVTKFWFNPGIILVNLFKEGSTKFNNNKKKL